MENTSTPTVMIIDDEADLRDSVSQWLKLSGFEADSFEAAEDALKVLTADYPGIVLTDIRMPGIDGMTLLRRLQSIDPGLPVILMTGHGDVPMAVEAMRIGAYDFVEKPFQPEQLADLCSRAAQLRARTMETRALRKELSDPNAMLRKLVGESPAIEKLRENILDIAQADGHVLVTGETGTGKSLVAKSVHACGPRASKPMITLNCASTERELQDAILFGGPNWPEKPLVEQAEGGTLCLEDIEHLSDAAQAKLLDLINAVSDGPETARPVNVRVIAVSSVLTGGSGSVEGFRNDLYYRLAALVLQAPPLRNRGKDILTLFTNYTVELADEYGCEAPQLNAADAANLIQAPWPGNVRQLINLAERAVLQSRRGENNISALLIDDGFEAPSMAIDTDKPLKEHVEMFEKMLIDHALRRNAGSVSAVMAELALPRRTLNEKMAKYNLSRQNYLNG
ncbi:sigma-54-dependent transcriptional regulator [Amaricoccus tamworthensis]|uniref:sigma-54-dependent transcriptional regulator n=1 Tax=Amaricoccus tamworthensis TaxID=57002 RepID=UPI003C7C4948